MKKEICFYIFIIILESKIAQWRNPGLCWHVYF